MLTQPLLRASAILPLLVLVSLPARATVYNDGGTHTISGADTDVVIDNGTTVNIVAGAVVTGGPGFPLFAGPPAVQVLDGASVLQVTGGSIAGGDGDKYGGDGIDAQGQISIWGGTIRGGATGPTIGLGFHSGAGGGFGGYQSLAISGGDFFGGTGGNGGDGVGINASGVTAYVSGGNFTGGSATGANNRAGDGMLIVGSPPGLLSALISGGRFNGGLGPDAWGLRLVAANVEVTGGQFDTPSTLEQGSLLHVGGGYFPGHVELHDNSLATVSSGVVNYFQTYDSAVLDVSGGSVASGGLFYDHSVVNVRGGRFSYVDVTSILSQQAVMNVYGRGLTYENQQLRGLLADGTPIDTTIWLWDSATLNLYEIPEPSSLALGALGLAACLACRRLARRGLA